MLTSRHVLALGGVIALGGCVVPPPSGPAVMALPTANKDFAQFQSEDAGCRQTASQAIGVPLPTPGTVAPPPVPVDVAQDMQQNFDVAYTQCMYARGNRVTAPPVPAGYAGDPYYGGYSPYYAAYGYGLAPFVGVGIGFGGGYWRGGYGGWHGGWGGGYRGGYGGGYHGGGFRR